jgi:uncharacterized protein with GYD domain
LWQVVVINKIFLRFKWVSRCPVDSRKGENVMPTYVTLIKYTDQGSKGIKGLQEAQEEALKNAEKMGIKIIGFYNLMGEYDVIVISECANDEAAVAGSIMASSDGNIRTTTMRAFTSDEFWAIINKLP